MPNDNLGEPIFINETESLIAQYSASLSPGDLRSGSESAQLRYNEVTHENAPLASISSNDDVSRTYNTIEMDKDSDVESAISEDQEANFGIYQHMPEAHTAIPEGALTIRRGSQLSEQPKLIQVVLLRYYIHNLARWFDICDPEKRFELAVPARARSCPPLMNAILCASARHISRASRNMQNVEISEISGLADELAVRFHSAAIQSLLDRTSDQESLGDEDLLTAVILLRWYEEVDAPLREDNEHSELFLRVIKIFIYKQFEVSPGTTHAFSPLATYSHTPKESDLNKEVSQCSPCSMNARRNTDVSCPGLCHASFWVAFRQEIYYCLLYQRSFHLPLTRCSPYRSFEPADDPTWAYRLIVFCADCIEFCYGSIETETGNSPVPCFLQTDQATTIHRWQELKRLESKWSSQLPSSFEPIYSEIDESPHPGIFPSLWYLADWHVFGLQHLELARILLTVYDPTRPRLGIGHLSSMNELSLAVRAIVRRLCGMALGNKSLPPIVATGCLGIVMCGDHFTDPAEQEMLLSLLAMIEYEHGWPFSNIADRLRTVWGV